MTAEGERPVLLHGRALPLGSLSPDEFERFVHAAFLVLGPTMGFTVTHKSGPGGDGGFDISGVRPDGRGVCVQCKRNKHTDLNEAALEIAKVALSSFVDGTDVAEYFLVASGTLAKNLHVAARETGHTKLTERALQKARDELGELRKAVNDRGSDPDATVRAFVGQLDRLEFWSGDEFDSHLGLVWSSLQTAIERAFTVQALLHEYPRPDFDEARYLRAFPDEVGLVPLIASRNSLPPNVRTASAASPTTPTPTQFVAEASPAHDVVIGTCAGDCIVLQSPGGGGKTKALEMAAYRAAMHRATDPSAALPVVVPLKDYRDSLQTLVHRALGVSHGHWTSIPGTFLLLLDGLNEMSTQDAHRLSSELQTKHMAVRTAIVITCRDSGVIRPVVLSGIRSSWSIARLTVEQIRRVAASSLPVGTVPAFMGEVLQRLNSPSGGRLFSLPFVVRAAVDAFLANGALPETLGAIIDELLHRRFLRNEELDAARGEPEVPELTLRELATDIAFRLRVANVRVSATQSEMQRLVHDALTGLRKRDVFGGAELTDTSALAALIRHELLVISHSGSYAFAHDLLAGFLAARRLAETWRSYLEGIYDPTAMDAWLFAMLHAPAADRLSLAAELAARDPVMAANAAVEAGIQDGLGAQLLAREPPTSAGSLAMSRWMEALAALGTEACIARLRVTFRGAAKHSARYNQAHYALCFAGDRTTLRALFPKVDHMQLREIRMRGGEMDLWQAAPPNVALSIARERVDGSDANEYLGECVRTLARYGDEVDAIRLESLIERTGIIDTLLHAGDALYRFEPRRAVAAIERVAPDADDLARISIYGWLAHRGGLCDTPWLVEVLLRPVENLAKEWVESGLLAGEHAVSDASMRQRQIGEVLQRTALSSVDIDRLVTAFATADSFTRVRIWAIGNAHRLERLDPPTFETLDRADAGPYEDVGYACNHASEREWTDEVHRRLIPHVVAFVQRADVKFTWHLARALNYLLKRDERTTVASVIEAHLRDWFETLDAAADGKSPSLLVGGSKKAATRQDGTVDLEHHLVTIRELIAEVADDLPVELRRRFLGVNTSEERDFACHRRVIEGVTSEQLDDELESIRDPKAHAFATVRLAALGSTPRRIAAWPKALAVWAKHPLGDDTLRAARNLWGVEVAKALIELVVADEWPPGMAGHAREELKAPIFPFDREILPLIDAAIPRANAEARDLLILWAERARRKPA